MAEISTKPYLIRAIYEWCTDNGYRPYIAVAVDERTIVPREFVRNGEIVLNVSAMATNRLQIGNELVEFEARFGGTPRQVSIPVENISAIFAQENGHGMAFEVPKALALAPSETQPLSGDEADDDGAAATGQGGDSAPAKAKADGAAGPAIVLATDAGRAAGSGADGIAAEGAAADGGAAAGGAGAAPVARAPSRRRRPKLAAVPTSAPGEPAASVAAPADAAAPSAGSGTPAVASAAPPASSAPAADAAGGAAGSSGGSAPSDASALAGSSAPASKTAAAPTPATGPSAVPAVASPGAAASSGRRASSDASSTSGASGTSGDDEPPPPPAGRPRLTRVK